MEKVVAFYLILYRWGVEVVEALLLTGWAAIVVVHRERFLRLLICLEVFMLLVFLLACFIFFVERREFGVFLLIIFLTMAVCEAVLGLALLVGSSRFCSSYRPHLFSILKF